MGEGKMKWKDSLIIAALGLFVFARAVQADWTPVKRLTWNSGESRAPVIAVDTWGNLHLVWEDDSPAPDAPEIYYKKSADGGTSWTAGKRLTWNSGDSTRPAMAVDSWGNVHVVWQDDTPGNYEIYYKNSQDGGASWTASQRITWTSGTSQAPTIAVDSGNNLHLLWYDYTPGNYEIFYKKSTNGGATWSPSQRLTWNSGWSGLPDVVVDSSGRVHVVWYDETPGNTELFYKQSPDGGDTWLSTQRLTWTSGFSQAPAVAVNPSGDLHLLWWDNTPGNAEIFYKKSLDSGSTWSIGQRLTWTSGDSQAPALTIDSSGGLDAVWWDNTPGNAEIFFRKGSPGGAAWTASLRLTWSPGNSYGPALAVSYLGHLHLVWYDDTPGNYEIYYKKFIQQRAGESLRKNCGQSIDLVAFAEGRDLAFQFLGPVDRLLVR
jgi:hypothetical protein